MGGGRGGGGCGGGRGAATGPRDGGAPAGMRRAGPNVRGWRECGGGGSGAEASARLTSARGRRQREGGVGARAASARGRRQREGGGTPTGDTPSGASAGPPLPVRAALPPPEPSPLAPAREPVPARPRGNLARRARTGACPVAPAQEPVPSHRAGASPAHTRRRSVRPLGVPYAPGPRQPPPSLGGAPYTSLPQIPQPSTHLPTSVDNFSKAAQPLTLSGEAMRGKTSHRGRESPQPVDNSPPSGVSEHPLTPESSTEPAPQRRSNWACSPAGRGSVPGGVGTGVPRRRVRTPRTRRDAV